jgi:serine/threonine protein kinase
MAVLGRCPDEDTLLAFLHGRLPARRSDVARHLEACATCADVATWAAAEPGMAPQLAPPVDRSAKASECPVGAQFAPGTRVGRYHILGAIGRGGMGEVYAAYHPDLDRRIALKVVHAERAADPERQRRLLREAQIIARLNHPNIVTVYDAGIVGDQVFVAMEFVDGHTLDTWVRQSDPCWQDVLDVFVAAARGLAAAHAANVVHRDFKPQNVMIGRDGRVRVMDFGLARPVGEIRPRGVSTGSVGGSIGSTSTTVGALVGTPAYMAPEQLRGGAIDVRADQFSFCVAMHEAIYRVRPGVGPG